MLPHVVVTSGVNTNQLKVSVKNEDSRLNHLPKSNFFASSHKGFSWQNLQVVSIYLHMAQISYGLVPFMVIDDKGGEIWTTV